MSTKKLTLEEKKAQYAKYLVSSGLEEEDAIGVTNTILDILKKRGRDLNDPDVLSTPAFVCFDNQNSEEYPGY